MSFHHHLISLKQGTEAQGAQRAFTTVCVLHPSLLHAMNPGNHINDMLQLMGPYLYDGSHWYDEDQARNTALQQQLDAVNSKLLDQSLIHNAEIFVFQGLLTKSQGTRVLPLAGFTSRHGPTSQTSMFYLF